MNTPIKDKGNDEWAALVGLAEYLGMNIIHQGPIVGVHQVQYQDGTAMAHGVGFACHEIAHWLMATPAQREVDNFGCGPDPDYAIKSQYTAPVLHSISAMAELELIVAALAEQIGYHLGDIRARSLSEVDDFDRNKLAQYKVLDSAGIPHIIIEYFEHLEEENS